MSRFWMVQHVIAWIYLMLNVIFHWSWWGFALGAADLIFTGLQFSAAAKRDDDRRADQVIVLNAPQR